MSTADPTAETAVEAPAERAAPAGLSDRLSRARSRVAGRQRRAAGPPSIDRVLTLAGSVILPLGLVVIFLGWYGAARTPLLFEQIPYLISGGLLGVGLMLGGGMLFFGSWLARMAEQDGRTSRELIDAVGELREALATAPVSAAAPAGDATATLLATPTGSMVHRPSCSVVAHRDDLVAVAPTADAKPCKICEPELPHRGSTGQGA